jgi:fumarate reductase subunit D
MSAIDAPVAIVLFSLLDPLGLPNPSNTCDSSQLLKSIEEVGGCAGCENPES